MSSVRPLPCYHIHATRGVGAPCVDLVLKFHEAPARG